VNLPAASVSSCGNPRRRNCVKSLVKRESRKFGPAETCTPSTGWPCGSTTMPAIEPVTSITSSTLDTSPRVVSTSFDCDAPVSCIATAASSRFGRPLISNSPLPSEYAWRGGSKIIPRRDEMPIRTRAPTTGCFAVSTTRPFTIAPADIVITMPVRSVLPSSVTSVDTPGAKSECAAANRNEPAPIAVNLNVPSAIVTAAS